MGKESMKWYPREGRRKPGKPATRWESEIIKHTGILRGRDARVRNRWRGLCPAMAALVISQ